MADIIYEPRAFWSVATVPVADTNISPQTVLFETQHFYNGERYPIEIQEITLSMINYARKRFANEAGAAGPAAGFVALSNILQQLQLVISARHRQSYSRYPVDASMLVNVPSSPQEPYALAAGPNISSFFGTVHRRFEPHLIVPKNGTLQFDMTPFDGFTVAGGGTTNATKYTVAFHELGTLLGANARIQQGLLADAQNAGARPFGPVITPQAMAASANGAALGGNALWPPQHSFSPRTFKAQSPAAQGSAEFFAMSVLLDQVAYDDNLIAFAATPSALAMLAHRVGCRMRVSDGGTKAWFWRPGAPLALVFPCITPALVFKLDKPITMGPGEQLEVELTVPAVPNGTLSGGDAPIPTTQEIGIALNGYCAAEG